MRLNPRQTAHYGAALLVALVPLTMNSSSAPPVDPAPTSARPEVHQAVSAALPTASRSATRFALLEEGEGDAAGASGDVRVSSPKGTQVWTASAMTDHNLPSAAQRAYRRAARTTAGADPACELPWTLLAGIGRVESDHGRYGGSTLGSDGVSRPRIIGVQLNGAGPVAAIRDTDNGRLDRDKVWDRAVGPMQFIPSTWSGSARDGDGDGVATPNDLDDAALAAAGYLCWGAGSVRDQAGMASAIYRYNQDDYYVALVMAFERGYRTGDFTLPPPPKDEEEKAGKRKKKQPADGASRARDRARDRAGDRTGDGSRSTEPKPDSGRQAGGSDKPSAGASASPSAKPRPSSSPSPTANPKPTPSPRPSPSPSSGPKLEPLSGTFTACGADSGWCVGDTALDLGPADRFGEEAAADFSGERVLGTNADEFSAMKGAQVQLAVTRSGDGAAVVYVINGEDYRYGDGSYA